jgi:ubiquinone/menaquinone biosynthesis C-methylase UbiE
MNKILITYTTLYRTGGDKFKQAAWTLSNEKKAQHPKQQIICQSVESKSQFLDEIEKIKKQGDEIEELHFFGHSGVYGIMFGTTQWPEQLSPFEWKQQTWPLAKNAKLYFHACRTARWFAPFLANHFKCLVYGYWWYTTVSGALSKFVWPHKKNVYIVSCAGRKSHGVLASALKYLGLAKLYPMIEFKPDDVGIDRSYDQVSEFYEHTFEDLRVRKDEWTWLTSEIDFAKKPNVLDIGCGNGAFLRQLGPQLSEGAGVDASAGMLNIAETKAKEKNLVNLTFNRISGPQLPFEDNRFDYVISVLSFRYLDWDPMVHEMLRVLKPGGRILILDMVAAPVKVIEWPRLLYHKLRHYWQRFQNPKYYQALSKMVRTPQWQQMLKYNPIRAEHEYSWYFKSRFPDSKYSCINIGWNSRIITIASEPIHFKTIQRQSFP